MAVQKHAVMLLQSDREETTNFGDGRRGLHRGAHGPDAALAHTVRMLRWRGYEVTVVDDLSRGYRHNVEAGPFHQLRVQQTDEMAEVLAGHDAVVHFAAYIAVGESMCVPEMYFENNVGGSLSLVTAMVRAGVKRLVFSSTAAVYGIPHASP